MPFKIVLVDEENEIDLCQVNISLYPTPGREETMMDILAEAAPGLSGDPLPNPNPAPNYRFQLTGVGQEEQSGINSAINYIAMQWGLDIIPRNLTREPADNRLRITQNVAASSRRLPVAPYLDAPVRANDYMVVVPLPGLREVSPFNGGADYQRLEMHVDSVDTNVDGNPIRLNLSSPLTRDVNEGTDLIGITPATTTAAPTTTPSPDGPGPLPENISGSNPQVQWAFLVYNDNTNAHLFTVYLRLAIKPNYEQVLLDAAANFIGPPISLAIVGTESVPSGTRARTPNNMGATITRRMSIQDEYADVGTTMYLGILNEIRDLINAAYPSRASNRKQFDDRLVVTGNVPVNATSIPVIAVNDSPIITSHYKVWLDAKSPTPQTDPLFVVDVDTITTDAESNPSVLNLSDPITRSINAGNNLLPILSEPDPTILTTTTTTTAAP